VAKHFVHRESIITFETYKALYDRFQISKQRKFLSFRLQSIHHYFQVPTFSVVTSPYSKMPHTTREREGFVTYHDDFESVSGDDIERQMAINTNAFLIGKHYPNEKNIAFIQANNQAVPIADKGTVYQMNVTDVVSVPKFQLHWKTHADGVRHFDSAVATYKVKWQESKWTDVDSVQDVQAEFDDIKTDDDFIGELEEALSNEQLAQLRRSH
jgi:hypothetical protein